MSQMVNIVYDKPHTNERGLHRLKRINLRMNEQQKYEVIKSLVDHDGNKKAAALKLGCTIRNINRLIAKYKEGGKEAFIHGNRGRKPVHALSDTAKTDIINIYNSKYFDSTFSYACELMAEHDNINISPSALTNLMYDNFITSPRTTKAVRKKLAKELRKRQKNTKSKKTYNELQSSIVEIENAHSRRPRCAYFGEMLQMDASLHHWYGTDKSQLHIAIDDATGNLVGAYFDEQETLNGYYNVFHQILNRYGIPAMFYTDRRTVFEYKKSGANKVENDTLTQFSYACKQLGVDIKTTSIAQAKGRVERAFQTLQQRLPIALRLAGITTKDEANVFLNSYIKKYNAKFALPIKNSKSIFEKQPNKEIINHTLAVITERTVDTGHCIKFNKQFYKTMDSRGLQVHHLQGTKGLVINTFDQQLLFSTGDKIYELDVVPDHESASKEFDFAPVEKPRKRKIPAANHPWRSENFLKFRNHSITDAMKVC
jgi:hypothetical protein